MMNETGAILNIKRNRLLVDDTGKHGPLNIENDVVAVEQPLQIILSYFDHSLKQWKSRQLAIVMRTPGQDKALVIGYLITQGVINNLSDITDIQLQEPNVAEISLHQTVKIDWQSLTRLFPSHSGCGVCGQTQLKKLALEHCTFSPEANWLEGSTVLTMPRLLTSKQQGFALTGGLHGAAIWREDKLDFYAEDVGRHNAVDKVIGEKFQANQHATHSVLILSGRVSFELVQKAIVARIPAIVAVGAPSDLAIATAKQFNVLLVGFVKSKHANIYCGEQQLK